MKASRKFSVASGQELPEQLLALPDHDLLNHFDPELRDRLAQLDHIALENPEDLRWVFGEVEEFTQAINDDPGDPARWYKRGQAHFGVTNYSAAIHDFERAIALAPPKPEWAPMVAVALFSIVQSQNYLRNWRDLHPTLERFIDVYGDAPWAVIRELAKEAKSFSWYAQFALGAYTLGVGKFEPQHWKTLFQQNGLPDWYRRRAEVEVAATICRYYGIQIFVDAISLSVANNDPIAGYDVPERIITKDELRELIGDTAALLLDRLSHEAEPPFPLLSEAEIKAIVAHGKKNRWDDREKRGWHYHTNAFKYVHVTYRRWVNRGLTREILKWADPSLHAHLKTKITREGGIPAWLDVPSGPDARIRAIPDPTERAELAIARKVSRNRMRKHRANLGD